MEGRVDFNALERSRLLGPLTAGSLGPLCPTSYSSGESTHSQHSSSLSRLGSASAVAAVGAGVTPPELTRAGSPTNLQQYAGRFLPSGSVHSPGANYAMMAGYLANPGHVPDSLKHLMPEFQQYWASASASAAHSEGYARYLLNSMYYPYLPYLPATESLSLFAQNSANAQVQAALQAQAVAQHRIYDLQKEAFFGSGSVPHGFYPPSYPFASGQLEATNLSLQSSSKVKQTEKSRDGDTRENEPKKDNDKIKEVDGNSERKRTYDGEKEQHHNGSERTRGLSSKTDDRDKIKSSSKNPKPNDASVTSSIGSAQQTSTAKSETRGKSNKSSASNELKHKSEKESINSNFKYSQESVVTYKTNEKKLDVDSGLASTSIIHNFSPNRPTAFHSPTRQERVVSPDRRSKVVRSPVRSQHMISPIRTPIVVSPAGAPNIISPIQRQCEKNSSSGIQEMPENLCVKDRQRDKEVEKTKTKKNVTHDQENDVTCVRTQTIVTGTTITVTSTLNVITSDSLCKQGKQDDVTTPKGLASPSSQISPTLSQSSTNTTYSLPYYHNLFARTQPPPSQQGKRVHAVTYVPEIGTVSSPIAGAPSVIHVIDTHKSVEENESEDIQTIEVETLKRNKGMVEKHVVDKTCAIHEKDNDDKNSDRPALKQDTETAMDSLQSACDLSKRSRIDSKTKSIESNKLGKDGTNESPSNTNESKDTKTRNNRDCVQKQSKSKKSEQPKSKDDDSSNECSFANKTNKNNTSKSLVSEERESENKLYKSNFQKKNTDKPVCSVTTGVNTISSSVNDSNISVCTVNRVHDLRHTSKRDKTATSRTENKTENVAKGKNKTNCDLNHNSKGKFDIKSTDTDNANMKLKQKQPTVLDLSDIIQVSEESNTGSDDKKCDNNKREEPATEPKDIKTDEKTNRQTTHVKPVCAQKQATDTQNTKYNNDNIRKSSTADPLKVTDTSIKNTKSTNSKQPDGHISTIAITGASSIPVGIAVARQRNIAPKVPTEKDVKRIGEDGKSKTQSPDIKQVRPLKIIRPSTKGATPSAIEKRNELPANLIVTGGSTTPGGVFWPDDPTSRQLAAQFLPSPITPTTWYGQSPFPFTQSATATTSDGSPGHQLPLTVPPGYKLAQDSLTGQILFIPAGTDVYDTSRVYSGFPLGSQLHQGAAFGPPLLAGQQATASLPSATTLFTGQQPVSERPTNLEFAIPQYQHIYNASVLPGSEVGVKADKSTTPLQTSASAVITSSVILSNGQESNAPLPVNINQDRTPDKEKLLNVTPSAIVADINIAPGQHCSYNFPSTSVPFVFNSSLLSAQNIAEPVPEVGQLKHEHTSVQSRGTSPMLPATDSSNEEEDTATHPTAKSIAKTDENDAISHADNEIQSCLDQEENPVIIKENIEDNIDTKPDCDNKVTRNDTCSHIVLEQDDISDKGDNEESKINVSISSTKESSFCDKPLTDSADSTLEKQNNCTSIVDNEDSTYSSKVSTKLESPTTACAPKTDRNIFTDLTEYNPFTDPQILQAVDGLELLSALAEKSSLCTKINVNTTDSDLKTSQKVKQETNTDDIYTFKEDKSPGCSPPKKCDYSNLSTSKNENEIKIKDNIDKSKPDKTSTDAPSETKLKQEKPKSRIKFGHGFKPKKKEEPQIITEKRTTTFCGITIPEDDDVIDSIEMEMRMRLAELQKRYKDKQRELAKLTPKKDKDMEKESEKSKQSSTDKAVDLKRGPGRPKKKQHESVEGADGASDAAVTKFKTHKKDHQGSTSNHSGSPPFGSHSVSNGNNGSQHGPTKKKKIAEMLVDRVFRKTGGSFKIPLSKKVNLIAPARIELPGGSSTVERNETVLHNKSLDFGKLIKRSRFSQLNGKDRSFVGGLWNRKEEKRRKHSLSHSSNIKLKKRKKEREFSAENGLGLLAEYATKTQEDSQKRKRKSEELKSSASPESPNKKRKPGRPKKCDSSRPGVTETIVAKQSKHMDFFRLQADEPKQERKISLEGKTPLNALYLDEWNVRRSERIFLNDPSPQTSPNAISPNAKPNVDENTRKTENEGKQETVKKVNEPSKKSRSIDLSQKVKKKYSTGFSQNKSRDKTTDLLKASRDRLTLKRQEKKMKIMSSSSCQTTCSDSDTDDVPLIAFMPRPKTPEQPKCLIDKDELTDGMRILLFKNGLFHEGELKAIRPPDIYGAILDNERRTRPYYFSQEDILKDAIQDVKPTSPGQMKEGTRICAYWSQQFSCLYPGTISRGSPNPNNDNSLFNVEFDDGDTGKIPLDHIRIIPGDFPLVEYDPNPLLLLTKRRRTVSISEGSEPRKSHSEATPTKETKAKRGPGRPPKTERMLSNMSVGDEDVFIDDENNDKKDKGTKTESTNEKSNKNDDQQVGPFQIRDPWAWSGSSTKRPGLKGKAKKEYYKTVVRGRETISVGECAVFVSTGRQNFPFVGRIEHFWESWGGQMMVKVKWFYHPEETKGGKCLQNMKGALFRSDHEDENDVQTISHKCEVLPYADFRRRRDVISLTVNDNVYYLAGSYEPTVGHIKFEPGVI